MGRLIAELITIGDELLYGQTVDTNAAFIGERLSDAGIELVFHTTVGDNLENLLVAFGTAMGRADVVLSTGGLGPTHDDITKKAICKFFKRQLVFHEEVLKTLKERYTSMGVEMPAITQNQALLPQGAKFIENKLGSALGLVIEERGKLLIAMPGVPAEMQPMMEEVISLLRQKIHGRYIVHRRLRTSGILEAAIYEKVRDLLDEKSAVKVAFLPSYRGVDIRLSVRAEDLAKGQEMIAQLETRFQERIGDYIYGYDRDELAEVVGRDLLQSSYTLAVAESCTGGLLGKLITDVPGSSQYFKGGVIAYDNQVKIALLGVPSNVIEEHGAVSEPTAKGMAQGVRKVCGTSHGLAITGIAGPGGGTAEKPVGLTYIGVADDNRCVAREFRFGADRERNRLRAAYAGLDLLRRFLKKGFPG